MEKIKNMFGMLNTEETVVNLKRNPDNLTVDQILKIRELELLEEIASELKYRNEQELP